MKKIFILSLSLSFALVSFAQQFNKIKECVILNGELRSIDVDYNPATGDRTVVVNGVRKNFYDVYPKSGPGYAMDQKWYINNEKVIFDGKPFVKYGLPRVLGTTDISKAGTYKSVNVYVADGIEGPVEVIYIPTRQGCEFQPYQLNCGSVKIEKSMGYKDTEFYTAKTTDLTGNIKYEWKATGISIVKGQGTETVGVDMKTAKNNNVAELMVIVSDAKNCPVKNYYSITVGDPSKAVILTNQSKWSAADRKDFMEECVTATGLAADKAKSYCSCMLEKIEKAHPDPAKVEQELKNSPLDTWAKDCLKY